MCSDCDKWHIVVVDSTEERNPMQVARYWRLKQHLYQLTVEIKADAEASEVQAVNSGDIKPVEVTAQLSTARSKKLAVVA